MRAVFDASVIVSGALADEARSELSRFSIELAIARGVTLVFPTIAITEVAAALARRGADAAASESVLHILAKHVDVEFVTVDRALAASAAKLATKAKLRGYDAVYAAVADARRAPLVTWDNELLTLAADYIEVRSPETWARDVENQPFSIQEKRSPRHQSQ